MAVTHDSHFLPLEPPQFFANIDPERSRPVSPRSKPSLVSLLAFRLQCTALLGGSFPRTVTLSRTKHFDVDKELDAMTMIRAVVA